MVCDLSLFCFEDVEGRGTLWRVAKVIEKRPGGTTVVILPAADAGELEVGASVEVRPAPEP